MYKYICVNLHLHISLARGHNKRALKGGGGHAQYPKKFYCIIVIS